MAVPFPDPPLADELVRLRSLEEEDVPALVAACQDAAIARFTFVPAPYSQEDARNWLKVAEEQRQTERGLHLVVADAGGGGLVGAVGLTFEWGHRRAEIGYWVAASARRRGIATSAVRTVSRWALHELDLIRIELIPDVENLPSRRVAERCGFVPEGVIRSRVEAKGRRWDQVMYSLLASDLSA